MAELEICNGERAGERLAIEQLLVIGRGKQADAMFKDNILSRQHARIEFLDDQWWVEDLGSSNGTFLNGHRVNREVLSDGDSLRMGMLKFRLHLPAPAEVEPEETPEANPQTKVVDNVTVADSLASLLPESLDAEQSQPLVARLGVLSNVGPQLAGFTNEADLLKAFLDYLIDAFPQAERASLHRVPVDHTPPAPLARERGARDGRSRISRSLAHRVMHERAAVLSADVDADARFDAKHTLAKLGLHTVMCAPLLADDEVLGAVQVDSAEAGSVFSRADMAVLLGVAGHAALALSKLRLQREQTRQELQARDLDLAERIQASFLPSAPPKVRGFRFAHAYRAAQQVGGDYYHYPQLGDGRTGITVGDVSGKGIPAALYMARLSSEMRYHALAESSPGKALTALNTVLSGEADTGMFATLVLMALDTKRGALAISSAGHPPVLWRRGGNKVSPVHAAGNIPLGMSGKVEYDETTITFPAGDCLLLYSDGVTEAMNVEQEEFGQDRLEEAFAEAPNEPQAIVDHISQALARHVGNAEQSDDITLVCIKRDSK